jgi:hypothetical protein
MESLRPGSATDEQQMNEISLARVIAGSLLGEPQDSILVKYKQDCRNPDFKRSNFDGGAK